MKKTKILLISFLVVFSGMMLSSMGYAATGDIAEGDAPKDIPADFWGIWLVVKYEPKDTDIFPDNNGHILEIAYIKIKAWQRRVHEGKVYVDPVTNYCPYIYVKDIGKIEVYDGKNDATDLVSGKEGKRFGDDSRSWNGNELMIGLASNYYKYASQKEAKIKITPKPDPNWVNYPPIKTNLDSLKEPRTLEIAQWVDYRAIVKRIYSPDDYEFKLVGKAYLYVKGEGFPEDYVMPGDIVVCDGGADWFKKAIVDVFNSREYRAICDKVESVEISYEKVIRGAVINIIYRKIIFWIAKPVKWARILRLNLGARGRYHYYWSHTRTMIIRHEATHCYHLWALENKTKSGIVDGDGDKLPTNDTYIGTCVWRWQLDDIYWNGFKGDTKGNQDCSLERPKAITKSIAIPSDARKYIMEHRYYQRFDKIRSLILENIPKKPILDNGREVPNGRVSKKRVTVTFHYALGGSPGEFTSEFSLFPLTSELNNTIINSYGIILFNMDVVYAIWTPHLPCEYDCEETAGGVYKD